MPTITTKVVPTPNLLSSATVGRSAQTHGKTRCSSWVSVVIGLLRMIGVVTEDRANLGKATT
jgi:hypothetical protein